MDVELRVNKPLLMRMIDQCLGDGGAMRDNGVGGG